MECLKKCMPFKKSLETPPSANISTGIFSTTHSHYSYHVSLFVILCLTILGSDAEVPEDLRYVLMLYCNSIISFLEKVPSGKCKINLSFCFQLVQCTHKLTVIIPMATSTQVYQCIPISPCPRPPPPHLSIPMLILLQCKKT